MLCKRNNFSSAPWFQIHLLAMLLETTGVPLHTLTQCHFHNCWLLPLLRAWLGIQACQTAVLKCTQWEDRCNLVLCYVHALDCFQNSLSLMIFCFAQLFEIIQGILLPMVTWDDLFSSFWLTGLWLKNKKQQEGRTSEKVSWNTKINPMFGLKKECIHHCQQSLLNTSQQQQAKSKCGWNKLLGHHQFCFLHSLSVTENENRCEWRCFVCTSDGPWRLRSVFGSNKFGCTLNSNQMTVSSGPEFLREKFVVKNHTFEFKPGSFILDFHKEVVQSHIRRNKSKVWMPFGCFNNHKNICPSTCEVVHLAFACTREMCKEA